MSSPFLWPLLIAGFTAGIHLFFSGLSAFRLKRLIENTPTSKIEAVAIGPVEVCGNVEPCETLLLGPFTKKGCVCCKYTIEVEGKNGFKEIKSQDDRTRFYVKDGTGKLMVDPNKARIEIPSRYEVCSDRKNDPPDGVKEFLDKIGIKYKFLGTNCVMRFREYNIVPDDSLYVMGTADANIDEPDSLVIQKGINEKTFYISGSPEKEILQDLHSKIVIGFVGSVLSLICLAIIL